MGNDLRRPRYKDAVHPDNHKDYMFLMNLLDELKTLPDDGFKKCVQAKFYLSNILDNVQPLRSSGKS